MSAGCERRQPRAGRLDLLLSDPETHTRYEVEIQLGATDESHIIRTIEYWDIEKSRYPLYEHVAVIVAEDITSRFLNVISLFNKAIPLIAIQLRALDVGGVLTINATRVLDLVQVGTEEEDEPGQATDRGFWVNRGSEASVAVADQVLALINEVTPGMALKYNKQYVAWNATESSTTSYSSGRAGKARSSVSASRAVTKQVLLSTSRVWTALSTTTAVAGIASGSPRQTSPPTVICCWN